MIDLNQIIVISLAVLAFFSFCTFILIIPIAIQLSKTLSSAKFLLDTVNEFEPEVKEVKQSIKNVKDIVRHSTSSVQSNLGETGIFVVSSVYGVLAGVKEYFSDYKNPENSYNGKSEVRENV